MPKAFVIIGVRFNPEEAEQLEIWRRAQPLTVSLSAAVRHLVVAGLEVETKAKLEESHGRSRRPK